ncbi:hypothetical protein [Streptacidiphilus albus]|uniref:hypothetical protein n=1 Tax=Streptacidiphilus albus TaxID=105425 RepID=UPI00128BD8F6|nr:hypothetical protein [Streptacidiphilus albus]
MGEAGSSAAAVGAEVLQALRDFAAGAAGSAELLADALAALESGKGLHTVPPVWWGDFDQGVRWNGCWTVRSAETSDALRSLLPAPWQWALSVCGADGRRRESALLADSAPVGHPLLLPLLVVRCSDWAEPVRRRAEQRLAQTLASAGPADLAQACAVAWACETRARGGAAVLLVDQWLSEADPVVWRHLFALPDHHTRRRALAEALRLHALSAAELVGLALRDSDVNVARRAAEHVLLQTVPAVDRPVADSTWTVVDQLLTARVPQVRAAAVTVLRRTQRPDLAAAFLLDRSTLVRETARWVVRSHGQDPAAACRGLIDRPGFVAGAGAVRGLAECGDTTDVPWLRLQLNSHRAKARTAAVDALSALAPMDSEELLTLLEHDPSPSLGRAATAALAPHAQHIPPARLRAWLSPGRRPNLRVQAAALLRATDTWTRLETDLHLLTDPDPAMARTAGTDLRTWTTLSSPGSGRPTPAQAASIKALLASSEDLLDTWTLRQLHFRIPA